MVLPATAYISVVLDTLVASMLVMYASALTGTTSASFRPLSVVPAVACRIGSSGLFTLLSSSSMTIGVSSVPFESNGSLPGTDEEVLVEDEDDEDDELDDEELELDVVLLLSLDASRKAFSSLEVYRGELLSSF